MPQFWPSFSYWTDGLTFYLENTLVYWGICGRLNDCKVPSCITNQKASPFHHLDWKLVWAVCADTLCLVFANISTLISSVKNILLQKFCCCFFFRCNFANLNYGRTLCLLVFFSWSLCPGNSSKQAIMSNVFLIVLSQTLTGLYNLI